MPVTFAMDRKTLHTSDSVHVLSLGKTSIPSEVCAEQGDSSLKAPAKSLETAMKSPRLGN